MEYPVIHVFLPTDNCDFEITKDARLITRYGDVEDPRSNEPPPMKGVYFQEEEIDEDGHVESQIDDSMQHWNESPMNQLCHKKMPSNRPSLGRDLSDNGFLQPVTRESGTQKDMELDFDQRLIDAYSDLIAQMNPDEFLNLDGECAGKGQVCSVGNEVEEGEILE